LKLVVVAQALSLALLWRRQLAPELLELGAQPQSVTRINRKVLIGGAAIVLLFISGITLVALKPPRLRISNPNELLTSSTSRSRMRFQDSRRSTKM
jgi:hypothetical protein